MVCGQSVQKIAEWGTTDGMTVSELFVEMKKQGCDYVVALGEQTCCGVHTVAAHLDTSQQLC